MPSVDRAAAQEIAIPHIRTPHDVHTALLVEKQRLLGIFGVRDKMNEILEGMWQMGSMMPASEGIHLLAYYHEPVTTRSGVFRGPRKRQVRHTIIIGGMTDPQSQNSYTLPEVYLGVAIAIDPRKYNGDFTDQSFTLADTTLTDLDSPRSPRSYKPHLSFDEMLIAKAKLGDAGYRSTVDLRNPGPREFLTEAMTGEHPFRPWGLYRGSKAENNIKAFDRQLVDYILVAGFLQKPLAAHAQEAAQALRG